ncbi:pentapeptide repeat-containing protein, partial [Salmonella enterica subsp. enterica]|nr:pentapeptide repeat-containing protein [Salmonella enterica subsp. enterica]
MKNLMSNEEYFEESFHDLESSKNILEKVGFESCSFEHCNLTSAKFISC